MTRVSKTSSTSIDLMPVSDTDIISQRGVLDLGISDHCLINCTRKVLRNTINSHNTVKIKSLENYSKETFQMSTGVQLYVQIMLSKLGKISNLFLCLLLIILPL